MCSLLSQFFCIVQIGVCLVSVPNSDPTSDLPVISLEHLYEILYDTDEFIAFIDRLEAGDSNSLSVDKDTRTPPRVAARTFFPQMLIDPTVFIDNDSGVIKSNTQLRFSGTMVDLQRLGVDTGNSKTSGGGFYTVVFPLSVYLRIKSDSSTIHLQTSAVQIEANRDDWSSSGKSSDGAMLKKPRNDDSCSVLGPLVLVEVPDKERHLSIYVIGCVPTNPCEQTSNAMLQVARFDVRTGCGMDKTIPLTGLVQGIYVVRIRDRIANKNAATIGPRAIGTNESLEIAIGVD